MTEQETFDASLKVGDTVEARWRTHGIRQRCEAVIEVLGDSTILVHLIDPDKLHAERPCIGLPRAHNPLGHGGWGAFPTGNQKEARRQ